MHGFNGAGKAELVRSAAAHAKLQEPIAALAPCTVEVLDRATMHLFVRGNCTAIAAPVQRDVDGVPKGPRCVRLKRANAT
jgi:hypothetical protein